MNNKILDTNLLVGLIRSDFFRNKFYEKYPLSENNLIISVVSEGEVLALSIKWGWGQRKIDCFFELLLDLVVYPIKTKAIVDTYAKIDAYSQGKLPNNPLPDKMSARNMGKNDLWIAATAHVTNSTLITTDKDFNHLNKSFIDLDTVKPSTFL